MDPDEKRRSDASREQLQTESGFEHIWGKALHLRNVATITYKATPKPAKLGVVATVIGLLFWWRRHKR